MRTTSSSAKKIEARPPRFPFQFRLPQGRQVDPWFSLNRSAWNALILPTTPNGFRPQVKSITSRQPGKSREIRIVIFSSAKAYFARLRAEQLKQPAQIAA